jgi:hypothetical protein
MIKLTGLWENKTSDGKQFLAGNIGNARILIFQNDYKKEERHPDYYLFIDEKKEQEERAPF